MLKYPEINCMDFNEEYEGNHQKYQQASMNEFTT